jgi:hypothetical protein
VWHINSQFRRFAEPDAIEAHAHRDRFALGQ